VATGNKDVQKAGTNTVVPPVVPDDDAVYDKLTPENKVAYRQAKLALEQAVAAYHDARRAAEQEAGKPQRDFNAARDAYRDAVKQLKGDAGDGGLVGQAQARLTKLSNLAESLNAKDLIDPTRPDEPKTQVTKLQDALDAYKACIAEIAKQQQAVEDAKIALQKVSEPKPGKFDPEDADASKAAIRLANEQKMLTLAQAEIPVDAAFDAYDRKLSELKGTGSRVLQ